MRGGIIVNGCVLLFSTLAACSIGIMDLASLSLARQLLSNSSTHVDMLASIKGHHFVAHSSCSQQFCLIHCLLTTHCSRCGHQPHPRTIVSPQFVRVLIVKVRLSVVCGSFHLRKISALMLLVCVQVLIDM